MDNSGSSDLPGQKKSNTEKWMSWRGMRETKKGGMQFNRETISLREQWILTCERQKMHWDKIGHIGHQHDQQYSTPATNTHTSETNRLISKY